MKREYRTSESEWRTTRPSYSYSKMLWMKVDGRYVKLPGREIPKQRFDLLHVLNTLTVLTVIWITGSYLLS